MDSSQVHVSGASVPGGAKLFPLGDIAYDLPNGTIKLIGRKSDLIKGPQGEVNFAVVFAKNIAFAMNC